MKKSMIAAVLAAGLVVGTVTAPGAGAATPINLHKVNLKNATIPGAACFSSKPITLHNGHGTGGKLNTIKLVADTYGKPVYGDLTHDGRDEALLSIVCSTGGGTAGSNVKFSWAVFTGASGKVRSLGLLTATHQFFNTPPTVLETPKIKGDVATVAEAVYFPTDPDCCPAESASAAWWVHGGKLQVKSRSLRITDHIVGPTFVGHAYLADTVAQLKKAYGTVSSEVLATGCRVYWHGKQASSFGALIDSTSKGRVFGIYAPPGAVTRSGIGRYSTLAQIKKAYHAYTITTGTSDAGPQVYVKLASSYLAFTMVKQDGSTTVRSIRIGTRAFVTGSHTCTS